MNKEQEFNVIATENYLKNNGIDETSNLGEILGVLVEEGEDVAIQILGSLLDLAKFKGQSEGYQEGIKQKADVMKKQWQDEARKEVKEDIFCSTCGFPKEWERNPVFLTDDMFSLMHVEDNICEECGHQSDGYTIKKLEPLLQKYLEFGKRRAIKDFEKEKAELVKQKQDIIRKEGYPASDIIAVLRNEIREEVEKMIEIICDDKNCGKKYSFYCKNSCALEELKSKLNSHNSISETPNKKQNCDTRKGGGERRNNQE